MFGPLKFPPLRSINVHFENTEQSCEAADLAAVSLWIATDGAAPRLPLLLRHSTQVPGVVRFLGLEEQQVDSVYIRGSIVLPLALQAADFNTETNPEFHIKVTIY